MAVSKAHIKATNKWMAKAYDRVNLTLPKGQKEVVQAHAAAHSESVNGFIGRAILEAMERDGNGAAAPGDGPVERDGGGMPAGGPKEAEGAPAGEVVALPSETLRTTQEAAEIGKQPASIDKVKAWENISELFRNMGEVDLYKARDERFGIVCLTPDTLEAAWRAAEATGEALPDFVRRAVETQAKRDKASLSLGINPAKSE